VTDDANDVLPDKARDSPRIKLVKRADFVEDKEDGTRAYNRNKLTGRIFIQNRIGKDVRMSFGAEYGANLKKTSQPDLHELMSVVVSSCMGAGWCF
jgi:hypothetical protein